MQRSVALEISINAGSADNVPPTNTIDALSLAMLVPPPIATPNPAAASAAESFTPSPTIMALSPWRRITSSLLSGVASAVIMS